MGISMAEVRAFRGVRPNAGLARLVAAPPYDVLSGAEAKEIAKGNPYSFLRVDKAEIELEGAGPGDQQVYAKAGENLRRMIEGGVFVQDESPSLYIYRLTMDGRAQTGLAACVSADEYFAGIVKKHEMTRQDKLEDRIRHVDATDANTGPIFMAYRNEGGEAADLMAAWARDHEPICDFTASFASTPQDAIYLKEGIRHQMWRVDEESAIEALIGAFKKIPSLYIADGHHRMAAGAQVCLKRRKQGASEESSGILSVIFPHDELKIMDYNRVARDLNGLSEEAFIKEIEKNFLVDSRSSAEKPARKGQFLMRLPGRWLSLELARERGGDSPLDGLDVAALQTLLLDPVLGIKKPGEDKRIDFVGGMRGLAELERKVDSGEMAVAFALYPTSFEDLMLVADSGQVMPPKSTWFEPKLRSGLLLHLLK
jgi:uncharacterized protein (DUF1015 family)